MKLDLFAALLAPTSILSGWITISVAIYASPWFDLFSGAISDMGRLGLPTAYLLNDGLMITSLLMMAYSVFLLRFMRLSLGHFSAGFFLASFYLFLISEFPEGTTPHPTLPYQFFAYTLFSMLLFGISLFREGYLYNGAISVFCFIAGISGSLLVRWPSVATLELYNVVLITIGVMNLFHQNLCAIRSVCLSSDQRQAWRERAR